jgi:hypothetical protein
VDVCQDGILVVAELGDGPLDGDGFALNSYQANHNIIYLYVVRLTIPTGLDIRSLVGICESGVIATGNVCYSVSSALEGAGYRSHVTNMLSVDGKWVMICVEMASSLYALQWQSTIPDTTTHNQLLRTWKCGDFL